MPIIWHLKLQHIIIFWFNNKKKKAIKNERELKIMKREMK